jgi:hypothetical protein
MGMLNGDFKILHYNKYAKQWGCKPNILGGYFYADTPTLALLKAIASQIGAEI